MLDGEKRSAASIGPSIPAAERSPDELSSALESNHIDPCEPVASNHRRLDNPVFYRRRKIIKGRIEHSKRTIWLHIAPRAANIFFGQVEPAKSGQSISS